jgi:hypothetical protein
METQKSPLTKKAVHSSRLKTIQIGVSDLKVGMFITELDRPWIETSFLLQGFEVKDGADIALVRKYCETVYVEEKHILGRQGQQNGQMLRVPRQVTAPTRPASTHERGRARSPFLIRLLLFTLLLFLPLQVSA